MTRGTAQYAVFSNWNNNMQGCYNHFKRLKVTFMPKIDSLCLVTTLVEVFLNQKWLVVLCVYSEHIIWLLSYKMAVKNVEWHQKLLLCKRWLRLKETGLQIFFFFLFCFNVWLLNQFSMILHGTCINCAW